MHITLAVAKLKKIQLRRGFEAKDAILRRLKKCQPNFTTLNLFSFKQETQAGFIRVGIRELFFYASSVLHEFVCLGDIGHVWLCLYFMSFVL